MRTLAATACFTFAGLLTACSPNLGDGRILCAMTAPLCPDGYACVSGRCYRGAPDASEMADASVDVADGDAPLEEDAPIRPDVGTDAGPPDEACTPSAAGALREDEDLDGRFDEGCDLKVSLVHPITDALPPGAAAIRFPRVSADGRTLTFCRVDRLNQQVWQSTRSSTNARFNAPIQLVFSSAVSACAAQPFEGRYFFEGRPAAGASERIYEGTSGEARELSSAVVGGGGSGHPFVSALGTELFFEGNRRRDAFGVLSDGLHVSNRSPTGEIETPRRIVFLDDATRPRRDMFPTLSPDGLTLFFVRLTPTTPPTTPATTTATAMFATRMVVGSHNFTRPIELPLVLTPLGSFSPSFATWEVFSSSASVHATAGNLSVGNPNEGLFRARLCAGLCPSAAPLVPCGGIRSTDGLHCYTVESAALSYARAERACATGGSLDGLRRHALASVHSDEERGLLWVTGTPGERWVGAMGTDWPWASGEPNTDALAASVYWADGEPSNASLGCVALSSTAMRGSVTGGFGVSTDCMASRMAVCEVDLWPTW